MVVSYLILVETAKARFYGAVAHGPKPASTHEQRVARRAARFTHHRARPARPARR